jgi:hypothetical protein
VEGLPENGAVAPSENGQPAPEAVQQAPVEEEPPPAVEDYTPEDALDEQISDLEAWADALVRRNRIEGARFWSLRGVAFCAAATALALALKGFTTAPVALIALAALGIAIEMGWPSTSQRTVNRRAVYDLRELQCAVKLRWQKVRLSYPDTTSRKRLAHAVELLELIHRTREEVGSYLGSSEPNRGIKRSS